LEGEIYALCCAQGRAVLKTAIEAYDRELGGRRDKKAYRQKGLRRRTLKTVMGEVEYERAVYETVGEDGMKRSVYLLDEAIGVGGSGYFSGMLSEYIVKAACEGTYRSAARAVSEATGQRLSHTAAWNVVQELGGRVEETERQAAKSAEEHHGAGEVETKVLFEEQDGIWLKMQGKSRKKYGASHEMKLAIAYDGAKKVGKKRYELTNKVACASFEYAGAFIKRKEGAIAAVYNVDEIETRLLNGDGAAWIKQSRSDDSVHFQLDPFHRNKAVRQWVKDEEKRELIFELLREKRIDDLLGCLEGYINNLVGTSEEEASERENLQSLLTYFTNNRAGLVPYHQRGLNLPEPPPGTEYRRMGAMESNVFTLIGNRMKGRRACWSINGGGNLARLLCLRATGKLPQTLRSLTAFALPDKYAEEAVSVLTSAKVAKSEGKGYNGFHQTAFPATPGFKWLRDIAALRSLSEL
jgi:hypothetical protein